MKDRGKMYVAPDGEKCKRVLFDGAPAGWVLGREGFEQDPDFYKKMKPKKVRYRDGHKEFFDPTRHC